jgi:O-antigen ligase
MTFKLTYDKLIGVSIVTLMFTFPISSGFISVLGLNSTVINFSIRAIISLMLIFVFFLSLKITIPKLDILQQLIAVFLFIYTVKILYDIEILGIQIGSSTPLTLYAMYFGNIILPVMVLIIFQDKIRIIDDNIIFWILLISCASIVLPILLLGSNGLYELFLARNVLASDGSGEEKAILNPITIGLHGELLAIVSIILNDKNKKNSISIYKLGIIVGVLTMILGASRGPILGFTICLFIFTLYRLNNLRKLSISGTIVFLLILSFAFFLVFNLNSDDFYVIERLNSLNEDDTRKQLLSSALSDFYKNPIFGHQFVLSDGGWYPHNIYLESFMSLGIIGGSVFIILILFTLIKIFKIFLNKQKTLFITAFIMLIYIIVGLTSSSLYGFYYFWIWITYFSIFTKKQLN